MKDRIYNILEVANVHGGNLKYLKELLDKFKAVKDVGIKFQPFKFDKIANEDFSHYHVYKELYFTPEEWSEVFTEASASGKEIWLDLFDTYGVQILEQNLSRVVGIKLQASVLYNQDLLTALARLDLSRAAIMINISGYDVSEIEAILESFGNIFSPKEVIIQAGFQGFPTSVVDSGLAKIGTLRTRFPGYRLAMADHTAHDSPDAVYLPIIAALVGFEVIEKHIMLAAETKYDYHSSLTIDQYNHYLNSLGNFRSALQGVFIPQKERDYLNKTIQIPFLNKDKNEAELIDLANDLDFKRTDKVGLNYTDLKKTVSGFFILRDKITKGDVIRSENLRRARIGAVIACRLKSSRLPHKATVKVRQELSSVEICLKNTLKFLNVDSVTLATSTVEEDAPLSQYNYHNDVKFFRGDPEDVIQRFLGVAEAQNLDVIVRQTADNMFMFNEILDILLRQHFLSGADYTTASKAAIGTNIEIMNVSALKKVKSHFKSANYSEYMTWYFQNNPEHFKLNFVTLPDNLVRDYRLTLDYPEDLEMFRQLIDKIGKGLEFTIHDVFGTLDKNPEIAAINANCVVKYQTDTTLIDTLNTYTKIK
jgi:N,N'-diacetyllegionaminate synthase